MAKISVEEVKRLARLSRLKLTDEEAKKFATEFDSILEYVSILDKIDTKGLEPTSQVTGLENISRPDEIIDYQVSQTDLLKNAPDQKDGYIKVKKVL